MAKIKKDPQGKTHRNLNELNTAEIEKLAKKLKIALLDHKETTLKKLIRDKWKAQGVIELTVMAVAKVEKKKKTRKENYSFNRKCTTEELTSKSMALSAACIDRNTLEDEKKSVNSEFKAKIDFETTKINLLAGEMQRGSENVLKTCEVIFDYDKATKIYSYEGKEVGREKMTKVDYQLEAEFPEGE